MDLSVNFDPSTGGGYTPPPMTGDFYRTAPSTGGFGGYGSGPSYDSIPSWADSFNAPSVIPTASQNAPAATNFVDTMENLGMAFEAAGGLVGAIRGNPFPMQTPITDRVRARKSAQERTERIEDMIRKYSGRSSGSKERPTMESKKPGEVDYSDVFDIPTLETYGVTPDLSSF
jgi:hypothetical protein